MAIAQIFPSIKPSLMLDFSKTKKLDSRVTFSRASTATYWDGVTQTKAEENLLKYSQDFDNAVWGQTSVTITANTTTAPDGTTTADSLVTANGSSGLWYLQQIPAVAAPALFSIYAKANTANHIGVALGNSGVFAGVDLSTGTVTLQGSGYVVTTTLIGGGWYRVTVAVAGGGDRARIFASTTPITVANQPVTGDGTSGIYIWGAQLEQRSQATAYTPTTDQPITKYQPVLQTAASGAPRFDHDPVTGECKGLLIEGQRTNLQKYSQSLFDWLNKVNVTVSSDVIVAPDGSVSADAIVETTANGGHYIFQSASQHSYTYIAGGNYVASAYVKPGTATAIQILLPNGAFGLNAYANFDIATGSVGYVSESVLSATISPGPNGFFRISVMATCTTAASAAGVTLVLCDNSSLNSSRLPSYTGSGRFLYAWGVQLEADSFPTSYIPTTVAQATRAADVAAMTGANFSSWYRQDEGTAFVEGFIPPQADSSVGNYYLSFSDGTVSNLMHIADVNGTRSQILTSGVTQFDQTIGAEPASAVKAAIAYKADNSILCVSGTIANSTDTSVAIPVVNTLTIGNRGDNNSASIANGTIKRIVYYPRRLSDTNLQALTS